MDIKQVKDNILYCFQNITGWHVEAEDLDLSNFKIPVFYHKMYDFLTVTKLDRDFVVAVVKQDESVTDIAKRREYFEEVFKKNIAFYFDELSYRTRQRLIQRKINFILGNRYLFVPFLGIFETRTFDEVWDHNTSVSLGLGGQRIILAYLNGLIQNGDNGKVIAKKLGVSPNTIVHGLKKLEFGGHCKLIQNGTAKEIKFPGRKELWEKLEDKLESPVQKILFVSNPPKNLALSGLSALSQKTLLTEGVKSYAIYKKRYKQIMDVLKPVPEGEGAKLEIWKWNPDLLAKDGVVDPFSLALSLKSEKDERILIAIDEMYPFT